MQKEGSYMFLFDWITGSKALNRRGNELSSLKMQTDQELIAMLVQGWL